MATSLPPDVLEPSGVDFLDFLPFGGSFDLPSTATPPYAIPDRHAFNGLDGGPQIGDAEAGPSGRYRDEVSTPMPVFSALRAHASASHWFSGGPDDPVPTNKIVLSLIEPEQTSSCT